MATKNPPPKKPSQGHLLKELDKPFKGIEDVFGAAFGRCPYTAVPLDALNPVCRRLGWNQTRRCVVMALLSLQHLSPVKVRASGVRIAERAYLKNVNTAYVELRQLVDDDLITVVTKGISNFAPSIYDVTKLMALLADTWARLRQEVAAEAKVGAVDGGAAAEDELVPLADDAAEPARRPASPTLAVVSDMTEDEAVRRLGGGA